MSQSSESSPDHSDDGASIFRGPANWFTLQIPASVDLHQNEAFFEVSPKLTQAQQEKAAKGVLLLPWSMTLYATWVDDDDAKSEATTLNPSTLFPGIIRSEAGLALEISPTSQSWKGVSLNSTGPWWQRIFQRRNTYEWCLWVIRRERILLVASLQSARGTQLSAEATETCRTILNTISFANELAKPPELFRRDVIALAKKHYPLLEIEPVGNFGIRINDSEIHLTNFYRSYLQAPDRLNQIVLPGLTTVVRLQEWGPEQLMPQLNDVADRIMPMLYPADESEESLTDFVKVPWVAGLNIMFVLDEDDTYRFVHSAMLESWDLSADDLQAVAMENLQRYSVDNPLEVTLVGEDGAPRILVPRNPNAYNSVRLLGHQLHGRLRQLLGAELVVGVPNRDFFVAVSLNHPDLIGQIQQQVQQDYQAMHHPLTSRLLVISADGVSEYCEEK